MKPGTLITEHGFDPESDDIDIVLARMDEQMRKNQRKRWYVEGKCMGWDRRNGFIWVSPENARGLLQYVLSYSDTAFRVYRLARKGLAINCFHHDNPTGEEWYYITTAKPNSPRPVLPSEKINKMLRKQAKATGQPFIF